MVRKRHRLRPKNGEQPSRCSPSPQHSASTPFPPRSKNRRWFCSRHRSVAYLALGFWAAHNRDIVSRLGLEKWKVRNGLRWGLLTGLLLGCLNTFVILSAYPYLGYDISFLKTTLHGRLPLLVMVPWFICGIALFVELNFRGFLLGRLAALESGLWRSGLVQRLSPLALITCALIFAFDPFMVNTFQHLHWIALWDGLIWGIIYLRTRNLCITIVAHAVEVIVMYSAVRFALST